MTRKTRDRLNEARERVMAVAAELQGALDDPRHAPDPDEDTLGAWADDLRSAACLIEDLP